MSEPYTPEEVSERIADNEACVQPETHIRRWAATVAALTAENERQAKTISFAVGWLSAMLERRQYEENHELREMQGMLAAAQVVEVTQHG